MGDVEGRRCRVVVQGPAATVTLERPERANALDGAMVDELLSIVDDVEASDCQVLVLRSAAEQFCAGFDLTDVPSSTSPMLTWRFLRIGVLLERLQTTSLFTIAVLQGPAIGAGADLAAACDARLATPRASLKFPGSVFGVVLGTRRLAALVGPSSAGRLAASGAAVAAEPALRMRLIDTVVQDGELEEEIDKLVASVSLRSPSTIASLKAATSMTDPAGLADLARSLAEHPDLASAMSRFARGARPTRRRETA